MVDELALLQNKHEEEKAVWKKENEELVAEKKCLSSWKVRCLDFKKKIQGESQGSIGR